MMGVFCFGAVGAHESVPVHFGHHQVEDDQVGMFAARHGEGFLAIVRGDDAVAFLREITFHEGDQSFFIVHNQDGFCHVRLLSEYTKFMNLPVFAGIGSAR